MEKVKVKSQGRVSGKIFRTKKMECSLLLFFGLFILLVSVIFSFFYHNKLDPANYDSYDILADAIQANNLNRININFYNDIFFELTYPTFQQGKTINYTYSIKKGHYFSSTFDPVFLIKKYTYSYSGSYILFANYSGSSPTSTGSFTFRIQADKKEPSGKNVLTEKEFSYSNNFSNFDVDTQTITNSYLTEVHLKFYYFNESKLAIGSSETNDYAGFVHDNLVYSSSSSSSSPSNVNIYVHFANEFLPFEFPAYSYTMVMVVSFIMLFIAFLSILFFLWHCWSYKYVLIKRAILESGVHFER